MKLKQLVRDFIDFFEEEPCHGLSLIHVLENTAPEVFNKRIPNTSHSIAELIEHMISWRVYLIKKIEGDATYSIELNSATDWSGQQPIETESDRKELLEKLRKNQQEVISLLEMKNDAWLESQTPGKNHNNEFLVRGILNHDIYHQGQINLIRNYFSNRAKN